MPFCLKIKLLAHNVKCLVPYKEVCFKSYCFCIFVENYNSIIYYEAD